MIIMKTGLHSVQTEVEQPTEDEKPAETTVSTGENVEVSESESTDLEDDYFSGIASGETEVERLTEDQKPA